MELSVGMYVRTKRGIFQITNDKTFIENKIEYIGVNGRYTCIGVNTITKASYNIIDLIEEGDYVNGYYVTSENQNVGSIYIAEIDGLGLHKKLYKNEIKSIVTKEQFESMEYKLEET